MFRVPLAFGLIAIVGCRQPALPPVATERPSSGVAVRAMIVHAGATGDSWGRGGAVRGRPLAWCADSRSNDPLLLDALELGTFDENDGSALDDVRAMHRIPRIPADQIAMVTDDESCERAARAYDAATFIYRSTPLGRSIDPVHVVSLGRVYLVESAGDRRRQGYEVKFFDRSWKHMRGGFGVEF
jgi:hypothetical protein